MKQQNEQLEIEVMDFDENCATLSISKSNIYFTVNLLPEQLEELALMLLEYKVRVESLRENK